MEDSSSLVERTKNKFYETKNMVDTKLGNHLSRSRSLLSGVNGSLRKSTNDDSTHSQRYFVDSFTPFREKNVSDSFRSNNSDPYRCNTRMASPTYVSKKTSALGMTETPRHVTQATWLLNTSNVTCNLSKNEVEDEQEKTPEILLKDPADLLKGENKSDDTKYEDKLTELLRDNSLDRQETKRVSLGSNNSMSYDIVSSLYLPKTTIGNKNVYGSNDFLNTFFNNSYNDLESLSQLFGANENNLTNPTNFYNNFNKNCDNTKNRLSQLNELFTEEFVNNSGVDFKEHAEALTSTLLKLNEQDKLKETELAPKVLVTEEGDKKVNREPKNVQFKTAPTVSKDITTGLETDLLSTFTIIRDDRTGRKMYRLSDFDKKFKTSSKSSSSVEVQTEPFSKEPEPLKKKYNTNVKIVYHNNTEGNVLTNRANSLKKQDIYAQQLLSNLKSRLEMKLDDREEQDVHLSDGVDDQDQMDEDDDIFRKVREYNAQLVHKEAEKMSRWREQRRPIYDLMNYNLKSGVRNSTMCRGGRRNTKILHNSRLASSIEERVDELYYISPSNRKVTESEEYYGYDLSEDDSVNRNGVDGLSLSGGHQESNVHARSDSGGFCYNHKNKSEDGNGGSVESEDEKQFNPIDHFEQWWRANTKELNMLRDKLSM